MSPDDSRFKMTRGLAFTREFNGLKETTGTEENTFSSVSLRITHGVSIYGVDMAGYQKLNCNQQVRKIATTMNNKKDDADNNGGDSGGGFGFHFLNNNNNNNNNNNVEQQGSSLLSTEITSNNNDGDAKDDEAKQPQASSQPRQAQQKYNSRKPKWWKNLCGKPSKAQKRAIHQVMKNLGIEMEGVPYGGFFNFDQVFGSSGSSSSDTHTASKEIWLEIGFGRGENLLALAHRRNCGKLNLIGAEISKTGVGNVCQRIEQGITTRSYWTGYVQYSSDKEPTQSNASMTTTSPSEVSQEQQPTSPPPNSMSNDEQQQEYEPISQSSGGDVDVDYKNNNNITPYSNLRIYQGDGAKCLPKIPSSTLSCVLVTFPDPFPSVQQSQWRVIQTGTLREIHRILIKKDKDNQERGILFLATDHEGYFKWSHEVMDQLNSNGQQQYFQQLDNQNRMDYLPAISRYEQKGWDEGRQTMLRWWQALPVDSSDDNTN